MGNAMTRSAIDIVETWAKVGEAIAEATPEPEPLLGKWVYFTIPPAANLVRWSSVTFWDWNGYTGSAGADDDARAKQKKRHHPVPPSVPGRYDRKHGR